MERRRLFLWIMIFLIALYVISINFPFLMTSNGRGGVAFSSTSLFLALLIIIVFYSVDKKFDIEFGSRHYLFITLIALTSFLSLYFAVDYYDKILHVVEPMMLSSISFQMMRKLKIDIRWKLIFTFFIIVACLGIFEIAEFSLDRTADLHLQGVFLLNDSGKLILTMDPLQDTVTDMLFGATSSLAYALSTYFYLRKRPKMPDSPRGKGADI